MSKPVDLQKKNRLSTNVLLYIHFFGSCFKERHRMFSSHSFPHSICCFSAESVELINYLRFIQIRCVSDEKKRYVFQLPYFRYPVLDMGQRVLLVQGIHKDCRVGTTHVLG